MNELKAASVFAALGNETRLSVLRLLVRAGVSGLNVMAIREAVAVPASTLVHHITMLEKAGLIIQEKQGRELVSRANFEQIKTITSFLMEDCCKGVFKAPAQISA